MTAPAIRCAAIAKTTGRQCQQWAIHGGTVCRKHGGGAPQVKARAAVRAEVMNWGLGDTHVDPGETLLRLVTQSAARAQRFAAELEAKVSDEGFEDAMASGLARRESEERDRCANFAAKAIAAGLNERMVRVAEQQGTLLAGIVTAALAEVQLAPEVSTALKAAIARQIRELV